MMAFWNPGNLDNLVIVYRFFRILLGGAIFPIDIMPSAFQAVMKWLAVLVQTVLPSLHLSWAD